MPKTIQKKSVHSPFPDIFSFRRWDFILLERYKPLFRKPDKTCHLCGLGPCRPLTNLSLAEAKGLPLASHSFVKGKPIKSPQPDFAKGGNEGGLGKCGIDETGFKARAALLDAVIGASGHISHAARLLEDLIIKFGEDCPVGAGLPTNIPTPITTLITGCKPKNLGELKEILAYTERQLVHLLSSINFGTEASPEDFVSKMLHTGMLDNLAMELADVAQISAMNMPKGESDSKLVNIGLEIIDVSKPVILIIGHNSFVAHEIMHLVEDRGLKDKIEVCGLCCAASDGARHSHDFKIIGNQALQLDVIKSGIADVVILDTQCIRPDIIAVADKVNSLVIATTQETAFGLKDLTDTPLDEASEYILKDGTGIILDKKKAAEAALKIATKNQERSGETEKRGDGDRSSPIPRFPDSPIHNFLRIGRGPVRDSEIRGVAPSIVMGEIPGIIGIFGCPEKESQESGVRSQESETKNLAEEFLKRGYIVSTGGCASMDVARKEVRSQESGVRREKQGGLFKNNPDFFDSGNLTNLGSCVSASHLIGACIKIAQIMCHRKLEGNYEEIADYIINRVGAVVILWGGFTQKAFSSALGMARLGIPVIFGPKFKNYGMHLIGREGEWLVNDARLGDTVLAGPVPQNLLCLAETPGDALSLAAKLCMRANDTSEGRKVKLKNYIELYKQNSGLMPEDIPLFIRMHYDIPEGLEDEIRPILKNRNWQPAFIPDPTILN